ncbi:MAG: hypothetical protein KIS92_11255 [Planctomycetota bacterium]|nr:hypothetical protein [Planctomycetota bacterium]
MSQPWTILTTRYGEDCTSPGAENLLAAIAELYHENLPDMNDGDYKEHPSAWLRIGYVNGPMHVIHINRHGEAIFEEWADQDFDKELAPPRRMAGISEQHAFQLWAWLAEGNLACIRSQPWLTQ